ncbi:hypothetical protein F4810DRAFT_652670 [Camillea tinctor]|nr:hypothetical protein F4810DRAFT_652670 [Camillea tinctor]
MLVAHSFGSQPHDIYFNYPTALVQEAFPILDSFNMAVSYHDQTQTTNAPLQPCDLSQVVQALEIARESPDGARDPIISKILDTYLSQVWDRVLAQPDTYVMSQLEFAVFNFFQHRFAGNKIAITARGRYWDNFTGS